MVTRGGDGGGTREGLVRVRVRVRVRGRVRARVRVRARARTRARGWDRVALGAKAAATQS